ncbi:MAG: hypothetical protein KDC92_16995, partial [Bacteroidetes bacterium]|nr:hypothetical protein [Bacteroidota bacterium]
HDAKFSKCSMDQGRIKFLMESNSIRSFSYGHKDNYTCAIKALLLDFCTKVDDHTYIDGIF